jgi:hypothetical protein
LTTFGSALAGAAAASVIGVQRVLAAGSDGQPIDVGGTYSDARTTTVIGSSDTQSPTLVSLGLGGSGTALEIGSGTGTGISGSSDTLVAQSATILGGKAAVMGSHKWGPGVSGSSGQAAGVLGDGPVGVQGKGG